MKVLVLLIKVAASLAALSQAANVTVASSTGSTSTPLKKGNSASAAASMAVSTSFNFFSISLTYAPQRACSRLPLLLVRASSSPFCAFLLRSTRSFTASACDAGAAFESSSSVFAAALRVLMPSFVEVSRSNAASSDSSSRPAMLVTFLTSASMAVKRFPSSAIAVFVLMTFSAEVDTFRSLASSWLTICSLACNCDTAPAALPLSSLILASRPFLASAATCDASFSIAWAFSPAFLSAAGAMPSGDSSGSAALWSFSSVSSAVESWASTSVAILAYLRSNVPLVISESFLFTSSSSRVCRPARSSVAESTSPSGSRLASINFCFSQPRAWPMDFSALLELSSASFKALAISSSSISSASSWNGASDSSHFATASSALSTFSRDCAIMCCTFTESRFVATSLTIFLSFSALSFARARTGSSSSLSAAASVLLSFSSKSLMVCTTAGSVEATSLSMAAMSSGVISSLTIATTFSTSSSAEVTLSISAFRTFFAFMRVCRSNLILLAGVSFFVASCSLACNAVNSSNWLLFGSDVAAPAFFNVKTATLTAFPAAVTLFCASAVALSTSAMLCFTSSLTSLGMSASKGLTISPKDSTAPSASVTASTAIGINFLMSLSWKAGFGASTFFGALSGCGFASVVGFPASLAAELLSLFSSMVKVACWVRSFGESFWNARNAVAPGGPSALAAWTSSVNDDCAAFRHSCCSCSCSIWAAFSSSLLAAFAAASASFAPATTSSTCLVAASTRGIHLELAVAGFAAAVAGLPAEAEALGAAIPVTAVLG
mmetsp:Transcript_52647/g.146656  ORF Transcript_52647/g.146656 Transcript_52647/m.146656 type:complete len:780 (+) Transcript_52647:3252-5591(+)